MPSQNPKTKPTLINSYAPKQRSLTIYSNGFAVVQEMRTLNLEQGQNQVQLDEIPKTYQPNSLFLLSYSCSGMSGVDGALTLGEVSLRDANLTPSNLLAKSIGSKITVRLRPGGGSQSSICGTLLSCAGSALIVCLKNGKIWLGNLSDNVHLEKLPEGLTNNSALVVDFSANCADFYVANFLYLANGLQWSANYKTIYDADKGQLRQFQAAVGVINNSGANFDNSTLKLIAGDIEQEGMRPMAFAAAASTLGGAQRGNMKPFAGGRASFQSVGDQKLYAVDSPVNLTNGVNKEILLFSAEDVPVDKEYFLPVGTYDSDFDSQTPEPVLIRLHVTNDENSHLGKPLPAGQVNIFQMDESGSPQLTAMSQMEHIACGERFELSLGTASDVKAQRRLIGVRDSDCEVEPSHPFGAFPPSSLSTNKNNVSEQNIADQQPSGNASQLPKVVAEHFSPLPISELPGNSSVGTVERTDGESTDEQNSGKDDEVPSYRHEVREIIIHNFKSDRDVAVNVYDEFPEQAKLQLGDLNLFVGNVIADHRRAPEFVAKTATTHVVQLQVPANHKAVLTYALVYRVRD